MSTRLNLATVALYAVVLATFMAFADARAVKRASPAVTLPFTRRLNTTGIPSLLAVDQARAKALKARAQSNPGGLKSPFAVVANVPATNQVVDYVATGSVGSPPTECAFRVSSCDKVSRG